MFRTEERLYSICRIAFQFHSSVEMLIPVEFLIFLGIWLLLRLILQWWNDTEKERRRYPPSLPTLPVVGSLPFLRGFKNLPDFFMRKAHEHGPIFTFRAGSKLVTNNTFGCCKLLSAHAHK